MSTREEIDAAVARQRDNYREYRNELIGSMTAWSKNAATEDRVGRDLQLLADAYLATRQQRERDQQPPTREMFERLPLLATDDHSLAWPDYSEHPWLCDSTGEGCVRLATLAKLRAACLLLGISTEGVL